MKNLDKLKNDFLYLRDKAASEKKILDKLQKEEADENYLKRWYEISHEGDQVYPSHGLIKTPYDYLDYNSVQMLPSELTVKTLRLRRFFLEMFNHPYRIYFLDKVNKSKFTAPPKIECKAITKTANDGLSLAIGDLGASVIGSEKQRISRRERYAQGPFIKLGKQARSIFVGSSSPDAWNSSVAVATMAACHCLAAIPRNGLLNDEKRQADFAKEVFEELGRLENQILKGRTDRNKVSKYWRRNVVGTLEGTPEDALARAKLLYKVGIRVFRVYSPEPGTGPAETTRLLRKLFGREIEIITSFIIDVEQAKKAEAAGADSIIVGIGGGGRCTTGVRSGSAIDWPELVFNLRGEIKIPVIVEGGASDHISVTLLLGASGISVSRMATGGTIESPGGLLFYSDTKGKLFKPYGGEASARTKFLDGKLLPFDIPSFVEGETTKAYISFEKHAMPTLTYNLHVLTEDAILALVFRGAKDISELHAINPSPLKRITVAGDFQRNTH